MPMVTVFVHFPLVVTYIDARAIRTDDYTPDADATITFADDVTAVTKTINVLADNILEHNEMFFLEITIPAGSATAMTARLDSPAIAEVIIKDRKI